MSISRDEDFNPEIGTLMNNRFLRRNLIFVLVIYGFVEKGTYLIFETGLFMTPMIIQVQLE